MATIPWTARPDPQPKLRTPSTSDRTNAHDVDPSTVLIQISRLQLRRARDIPGLLVAALRIRSATLASPGALGVSLRAEPLARRFWTLSSWTDETSIGNFVGSDAHRNVMVRFGDKMSSAHFHTWSLEVDSEYEPRWDDAIRRFDESRTASAT